MGSDRRRHGAEKRGDGKEGIETIVSSKQRDQQVRDTYERRFDPADAADPILPPEHDFKYPTLLPASGQGGSKPANSEEIERPVLPQSNQERTPDSIPLPLPQRSMNALQEAQEDKIVQDGLPQGHFSPLDTAGGEYTDGAYAGDYNIKSGAARRNLQEIDCPLVPTR